MLPIQIHFNPVYPTKDMFRLVEDEEDMDNDLDFKPRTALWSSSICDKYGSDWLRFICQDKRNHHSVCHDKSSPYLVIPDTQAEIYVIRNKEDVKALQKQYGSIDGWTYRYYGLAVNWWKFSRDYQGIRLTDHTMLNGWDCDSTAWLDWDAFTIEEFTNDNMINIMKNHITSLVNYLNRNKDNDNDWSW